MSSFAAHAEPRERDLPDEPLLKPGQELELVRLATLFDDLGIAFAELQRSRNHDAYASFEFKAQRFSAMAARFAKSVTANRPRPPHRS